MRGRQQEYWGQAASQPITCSRLTCWQARPQSHEKSRKRTACTDLHGGQSANVVAIEQYQRYPKYCRKHTERVITLPTEAKVWELSVKLQLILPTVIFTERWGSVEKWKQFNLREDREGSTINQCHSHGPRAHSQYTLKLHTYNLGEIFMVTPTTKYAILWTQDTRDANTKNLNR